MNGILIVVVGWFSLGIFPLMSQQVPQDYSSYPQQDGAQAPDASSPMPAAAPQASDLSASAPNPNDYSTAFAAAPVPTPQDPQGPVEEVKPAQVQDGISTVDLDSGNWLLKRKALEKVVDTIEMINRVFTNIVNARVAFVENRNKADKDYDQFILANGFSVGQLRTALEGLVVILNKERDRQGALSESEREALQLTNRQIVLVEHVQKDLDALAKLDESLDQVIGQLEEETNKAHSYQAGAWDNFQQIKMILSDQKAEDLYLKTEGLYTNIQDVYRYISRDLKNYFDQAVAKLHDTMAAMQITINELKQSEIDLAAEVKRLEGGDHTQPSAESAHAAKKESSSVNQPWYKKIAVVWEYPAQKVSDLITWFMGFLG